MGLAPQKSQEREPTELELLLQKWGQASAAPQSPEPEREELLSPLPEPRGEELPLPEPRGEELPLPEPRGEKPPLPEPRGEELPLPEPRWEELPLPEPRGEEPPLPEPRGEEPPLPELRGEVINKANDTLNGISSSSVCTEVIQSAQGMEYLLGVVEVYRVVRRVELGIKATAVCSDKLQQLLKDINRVWHNLIGFMSLANLSPDESSLDFSSCILRHGIKNAKELACGVCLLSVDSRSKAFSSETDSFKLMYGGHQYHASCANFWINCVEPKPPGLILPDLL
ncbi:UNVERIFIED_CONTAM: hypothetical protein FKN15_016798 [Acipenser sinensis]